MEDNIQSLPQDLRTKHPKRWTVENVCPWMTGWGSDFISDSVTHLQNGVDGDTIHDALSDTTQSRKDTVNSLEAPLGNRNGQLLRFTKEMDIFTVLYLS